MKYIFYHPSLFPWISSWSLLTNPPTYLHSYACHRFYYCDQYHIWLTWVDNSVTNQWTRNEQNNRQILPLIFFKNRNNINDSKFHKLSNDKKRNVVDRWESVILITMRKKKWESVLFLILFIFIKVLFSSME